MVEFLRASADDDFFGETALPHLDLFICNYVTNSGEERNQTCLPKERLTELLTYKWAS
jgi:hypothetical protein